MVLSALLKICPKHDNPPPPPKKEKKKKNKSQRHYQSDRAIGFGNLALPLILSVLVPLTLQLVVKCTDPKRLPKEWPSCFT